MNTKISFLLKSLFHESGLPLVILVLKTTVQTSVFYYRDQLYIRVVTATKDIEHLAAASGPRM